MEDSGVTSFSSSASVDISLDALDLSSSNPSAGEMSAGHCSDTAGVSELETTAGTEQANATAVEECAGLIDTLVQNELSPEKAEGELQSTQIQQKQVPIAQLLAKTGYSIVQANGQRRYGPPPDWEGPAPLRGCEVFVGKLPRDCFEDELVPVFEKVGKIYELRLMLDHYTGLNRGYCFVVFSAAAEAKECVRQLNNYEIRKGRSLGICMSVDNCRLFVGGIPKKVTKEDILLEMRKVTEGVVDVIVYPSASDKSKNRGFAFVEYESHRAAAMARRKLMNGRVDLWGHNIAVDWAEPELEVDEEIMAQVKVLYVRNLMLSTTEVQILETFSAFGVVERVKKIKDYAFVHFQSREDAHKAMNAINGSVLDGAQVEVTLAKPVDKDTYMRSPKMTRSCTLPAFYIPVDQFGTVLPCYPSYFSPPRYMMRNSMGACAMVQVPRPTGGRGLSGGGGGGGSVGGGGGGVRGGGGGGGVSPGGMFYPVAFSSPAPRYMCPVTPSPAAVPFYPAPHQPYYDQSVGVAKRAPDQEMVGLSGAPLVEVPAATHAPATPTSIKPAPKSCSMILEEICQKNNWGSPLYSLHSSTSTTPSGELDTLFLYKATIVGIGMTYIPSKLCRNLADAREVAAEHSLIQLGYPMEAATSGNYPTPPRPPTIQYSDAPPPLCPNSYVALPSPPKPVSWAPGTTPDHPPPQTIYASPFAENPFPPPAAYAPEYYQPGY